MKKYLGFCFFFLLGACRKDYYTMMASEGTCVAPTMTDACKDSMLRLWPIDHESFAEDTKLENQVLEGLHLLMTAPLAFPKDKKMLGLATIKEAEMHDFYDRFVKEEGTNLNQEMVNYVLHSAFTVKHGCIRDGRTYYTPSGIHICKGDSRVQMASTLLHEARHSETGAHVLYDKEDMRQIPVGDLGMDGPYGWQVALLWGFIHGNDQAAAPSMDQFTMESIMVLFRDFQFRYIFALPDPLAPISTDPSFFKEYLAHFQEIEQLTYPHPSPGSFFTDPSPFFTQPQMAILVKDLDRDGNEDVVVCGRHDFQVFWGRPNRQFEKSQSTQLHTDTDYSLAKVAALNVNQDGISDLVFVRNDGRVYVVQMSPFGSMPEVIREFSLPTYSATLEVLDFNQDGKDDLLYESSKQKLGIAFGTDTPGVFLSQDIRIPIGSGANLDFSMIEDVDQDGRPDFIFTSKTEEKPIVLGFLQSSFIIAMHPARSTRYLRNSFQDSRFALASLPGDQKGSWLSIESGINLHGMEPKKRALYAKSFSIGRNLQIDEKTKTGCYTESDILSGKTLIGDINKDGQLDVLDITHFAKQYTLRLYTNMMRGDCQTGGIMQLSSDENWKIHASQLGDFDGDGFLDVLIPSKDDLFVVFYNQGKREPGDTNAWK